jgi:hypothetical protein
MTALAQQGRWDESAFRAKLRDADFALLVLSCDVSLPNGCRGDTFSPGVLDAIRDGYDVLFRDVLYTYVPKVRQRPYTTLATSPKPQNSPKSK